MKELISDYEYRCVFKWSVIALFRHVRQFKDIYFDFFDNAEKTKISNFKHASINVQYEGECYVLSSVYVPICVLHLTNHR